jgi:hypothetical protein
MASSSLRRKMIARMSTLVVWAQQSARIFAAEMFAQSLQNVGALARRAPPSPSVLLDERALQDHRRATIVGTRTFGLPGLILSDDNAASLLPIISSTIESVYAERLAGPAIGALAMAESRLSMTPVRLGQNVGLFLPPQKSFLHKP